MGCLNSDQNFNHWFGNIHLSGKCNRSCYFCIGQHMMGLDPYNNLDEWPLKNIDKFIEESIKHKINDINITGSNTDPLLYKHTSEIKEYIKLRIPDLIFGIRTNGVLADSNDLLNLYDKGSITICSFDKTIYNKMMGNGNPPDLEKILFKYPHLKNKLKVNIVLGPENIKNDIYQTILNCNYLGIAKINMREPYGQPHIGDPLNGFFKKCIHKTFGMPHYHCTINGNTEITYWDVHYVEIESVNLYANGNISTLYPITKGYDINLGEVKTQDNFIGGRIRQQWLKY